MKDAVLVLGGAVLGGIVGHFAFGWLVGQGFYGLVLPGGLVGLGACLSSCRARWPAVICGLLALGVGLISEWRYFPFVKDASLSYFIGHVHQLKPITLLMLAAGTAIGFWVPFRRIELDREPKTQTSS